MQQAKSSKLKAQNFFKHIAGVSLFEILIVLSVFALLAAASTQTVILTLRGARKSDAIGLVRENVGYAMSVIERQLHNATYVSPCPNSDTSEISYEDQAGTASTFSCVDIGTTGYVASASARLTSEQVEVTSCSFICEPASGSVPPNVKISIEAIDPNAKSIEGANFTISTSVYLRSY